MYYLVSEMEDSFERRPTIDRRVVFGKQGDDLRPRVQPPANVLQGRCLPVFQGYAPSCEVQQDDVTLVKKGMSPINVNDETP